MYFCTLIFTACGASFNSVRFTFCPPMPPVALKGLVSIRIIIQILRELFWRFRFMSTYAITETFNMTDRCAASPVHLSFAPPVRFLLLSSLDSKPAVAFSSQVG